MTKSLFWLSDGAWGGIEPHLPCGQPGKPRVDDRTVISGILRVLRTGFRWRDVPPAHGPPSSTAIAGGRSATSGNASSRRWRQLAPFRQSSASTARMSRRTVRLKAQKGGCHKRLARRAVEERAKSIVWPMIAADRSPLR